MEQTSPSLKRALKLVSEQGASNWLTVLPVQKHGFTLHKKVFLMPLLCGMVGILLDIQHIALVVSSVFVEMKCRLNNSYNLSLENILIMPPLAPK